MICKTKLFIVSLLFVLIWFGALSFSYIEIQAQEFDPRRLDAQKFPDDLRMFPVGGEA